MNNNLSRLCDSVTKGHKPPESSAILGPGFHRHPNSGETPLSSTRSSLRDATRWELIERNLSEGLVFLREQDLRLGLAGSLLDEYRKALQKSEGATCIRRRTKLRLMHEVLARGLSNLRGETYRETPLFDDGTSVSLKFHVCVDGCREVIEITRANLAGPALGSLAFIDSQAPPGESVILEATREILELRTLNRRQSERLDFARERALSKMEMRRKHRSVLLGKGKGRSILKGGSNAPPKPNTPPEKHPVSLGRQLIAMILPRRLTALARFSN